MKHKSIISLDVGERRVGVAFADSKIRIPVPLVTLDVNGQEIDQLKSIVADKSVDIMVVGLPRNQQGEETKQSVAARDFAAKLQGLDVPVVFQDESLTSVLAEQNLVSIGKPFEKADIDKHAAAIILGDYLETHYGH
jgi:putative Holliday junction resolvase